MEVPHADTIGLTGMQALRILETVESCRELASPGGQSLLYCSLHSCPMVFFRSKVCLTTSEWIELVWSLHSLGISSYFFPLVKNHSNHVSQKVQELKKFK